MRGIPKACVAFAAALVAGPLLAQTQSTARPDDTPTFRLGATLFADWTWQQSPETKDTDGNTIHANAFNIGRAYLNATGNLNHRIAYRITPDIVRESGSGSSTSGSYTFRLKYAYAQFNLDDWTTKGSWIRFGMNQTPLIDFEESVYRYRFQGPVFVDREGLLSSSDTGLSGHWNFPAGYGDVHAGIYNGETYSRAEVNNQKAVQLRATVRPMPAAPVWRGLRFTGFIDADNYVSNAKRQRFVEEVTFEHARVNAGAELVQAKDRTSAQNSQTDANGFSLWLAPKLVNGWELLLRHDEFKPDKDTEQKRKRNIAGVAYWFQHLDKVTAAVMADYDSLRQSRFSSARPADTRYGVKLLINF